MGLPYEDGGVDPMGDVVAESHKIKISEMADAGFSCNPFKDVLVVHNTGGSGYKVVPKPSNYDTV